MTSNTSMTMQSAFMKTSVSLPTELMEYLRAKSAMEGIPLSRLVSQSVRAAFNAEKRRASK
jgi:hypothetical protein